MERGRHQNADRLPNRTGNRFSLGPRDLLGIQGVEDDHPSLVAMIPLRESLSAASTAGRWAARRCSASGAGVDVDFVRRSRTRNQEDTMLDMRTLLRGTAAAAGALMIVLAATPSAADILDD